ncbi:MAG: HD-GYP domain-containing protein [Sphingomonas sp.]|nr:HD-GYP domain-containing protein [Sphingomonas sp.]
MGMKVVGFEGSWLHHPFWKSNFVIDDAETLRRVQESSVAGVIIEIQAEEAPTPTAAPAASSIERKVITPALLAEARSDRAVASRSTSQDADLTRAKAVMNRARKVMFDLFEQARLGRAVRAGEVTALADEIADSVERNPGAMLNVARLKSKTEYTYMHSVAVCTLMINLAKTLNMPEETFRPIGLAGLLHDVGKVTIPLEILDKADKLTDPEYEEIKRHTINGRDLIAESADLPEIALDVCAHHHEKMDGTGYPFGLQGSALSIHARMGAICDVYDALTSDRVYKAGWTPQDALSSMQDWEGHFDLPLFFQFQRSIGIFPVGMLVELRSQRLGVILPTGRRNGRARARAFYDMRAQDFIPPEIVLLDDSLSHDQAMRQADPARWSLPNWDLARAALIDGKDPRPLLDRAA